MKTEFEREQPVDCENIDGFCITHGECKCELRRKQHRLASGWHNGDYFCIVVGARDTRDDIAVRIKAFRGEGSVIIKKTIWQEKILFFPDKELSKHYCSICKGTGKCQEYEDEWPCPLCDSK